MTLLHNTWFWPLNPCAVTLSWCAPDRFIRRVTLCRCDTVLVDGGFGCRKMRRHLRYFNLFAEEGVWRATGDRIQQPFIDREKPSLARNRRFRLQCSDFEIRETSVSLGPRSHVCIWRLTYYRRWWFFSNITDWSQNHIICKGVTEGAPEGATEGATEGVTKGVTKGATNGAKAWLKASSLVCHSFTSFQKATC